MVEKLSIEFRALLVPAYCVVQPASDRRSGQSVYVLFGAPLAAGTPAQTVLGEIQRLGDTLHENLRQGIDLSAGEAH